MRLQIARVMHVEQQRLDEVARAGAAHLGAVLPARFRRQQREVERRVELRPALRVEHLAALHVQLAGDLQAIQVAFAVAHDLVGPVAVFIGGRLPVAGVDVLRLPVARRGRKRSWSERPRARSPTGPRCGSISDASAPRRRAEAAIEIGVLGGQHAVQSRMEAAVPVSCRGRARRPQAAAWSRGTRGRRGSASP